MPEHHTMFADKPVLIILEGPDGTGKSTLANAIATAPVRTTPPYVRKKHGHTLSNEDLMRVTLELMTPQGFFSVEKIPPTNLVVCDRYEPISDPIYTSELYDADRSESSPFSIDHLDLWLNALDQSWSVLIIACQGYHGCAPKVPSGKESDEYFLLMQAHYDDIVSAYNRLHAPQNIALWRYNYRNSSGRAEFVYELASSVGPLCERCVYEHLCDKLGVMKSERKHFRWK